MVIIPNCWPIWITCLGQQYMLQFRGYYYKIKIINLWWLSDNVEILTSAFACLVTLSTTVRTELTYSILYEVPGGAVKHTSVFETQVVFLTAQTITGFSLTWSTSRSTAVTHIILWVTSGRKQQVLYDQWLKKYVNVWLCSSSHTFQVMGTYGKCTYLWIWSKMLHRYYSTRQ